MSKSYEWISCYDTNNNADMNYPALMSDGRLWTRYQPDAAVNQRIQEQNGIKSNWEYRQYLQDNAEYIMQQNCDIVEPGPLGANVPITFSGVYNMENVSDLKRSYLSREQLNSRMMAPTMNPNKK